MWARCSCVRSSHTLPYNARCFCSFSCCAFGRLLHYQIVGVIDHLSDLSFWNDSIENDRVPVFLIHVIAGTHLLVAIAEFQRQIGIAFQIHGRRHHIECSQCEHFSRDLEHNVFRTERCCLPRSGLAEQYSRKVSMFITPPKALR